MYLSSRLWAVYRTLRNCDDLNREWIISDLDTAPRVQCICAAGLRCWILSPGSLIRAVLSNFHITIVELWVSFLDKRIPQRGSRGTSIPNIP